MDFSQIELLGIPLINVDGLIEMLVRFAVTMLFSFIIIGWLYYSRSKRKDWCFCFTMIAVTVFLLIFLLGHEKLQIGLALGLFAIFGIVRYRTEAIAIREMSYLFMIIGIAVINGLATSVSYVELIVTNLIFVAAAWVMERSSLMDRVNVKLVTYEKINLITPDKYDEMMADLKARTGLEITKFEVGHIDFLKDIALVKVYYKTADKSINTVDGIRIAKDFTE
ncbi:MAG: DUF4956 domain-containing protein [Paludibacteraceae bacterium]|nr:DUF4956 domain-containing protein [Paludibacteraceae bacterium]